MSTYRHGVMDKDFACTDDIAHPSMQMKAKGSRFFREVSRKSIMKIEFDEVLTGLKVFNIVGTHIKPLVVEDQDYYPHPGCLFVSLMFLKFKVFVVLNHFMFSNCMLQKKKQSRQWCSVMNSGLYYSFCYYYYYYYYYYCYYYYYWPPQVQLRLLTIILSCNVSQGLMGQSNCKV